MIPEMNATPPPTNGTETSALAADRLTRGRQRPRHWRAILHSLADNGPQTDEELTLSAHIAGDSERPRRGELASHGLILKTTERRRTTNGNPAAVWAITPAGSAALRGLKTALDTPPARPAQRNPGA
jgi:hypothetical protein